MRTTRRTFLQLGAVGLASPPAWARKAAPPAATSPHEEVVEASLDDIGRRFDSGEWTAVSLTTAYLARIEAMDRAGPTLRSVIELNPDALTAAASADAERTSSGRRGPLHGVPVLVKDNVDTADRMQTTAGSLALLGSRPGEDAAVIARLRAAGAILLGKANLSEWANIRSGTSTSGWSARGGQCRNPYVLSHNPCGSSSGSAVAVAASLAPVAIATETDGSIICPAAFCGVVGVKPTVGRTSRAGVIPISHSQDTVGTHGRTVRDAALLLAAMIGGPDPRDPATASSPPFTLPAFDPGALRGARLGIPRADLFGYSRAADDATNAAIAVLKDAGAVIIDDVKLSVQVKELEAGELLVLLTELKADIAAYLATRVGPRPRTLADLIAFNREHPEELALFGQELFEQAETMGPLTDPAYQAALNDGRSAARRALNEALDRDRLDALVVPATTPAYPTDPYNGDHFTGACTTLSAIAGYPIITVPCGLAGLLPVGMALLGRAWSEARLLQLAHAYECARGPRARPGYAVALPG